MHLKTRGFWDSRGKRYSATLHVNGVDVSGSDGKSQAEAIGNLFLSHPHLFGTRVLPVEEGGETRPADSASATVIPDFQYGC